MEKSKVIIYHANNIWNWGYWDNYSIPVYGKCFLSKDEAEKDFKRWAKFLNIKNYKTEEQERDETL